ncbi:MAG: hypothetical protein FJ318_06105 [SAR202 cluster bacterium]|nr:hypothetical protein [SAR202 cluster bacterium]
MTEPTRENMTSRPGHRSVFPELLADIARRNELGWERHGVGLGPQTVDGLQEAYEEVLDLAAYLKAELMLREGER